MERVGKQGLVTWLPASPESLTAQKAGRISAYHASYSTPPNREPFTAAQKFGEESIRNVQHPGFRCVIALQVPEKPSSDLGMVIHQVIVAIIVWSLILAEVILISRRINLARILYNVLSLAGSAIYQSNQPD